MSSMNTKVKGFLKGALLVPMMGLVAHEVMGFLSNNYELNVNADWNWPTDSSYSLKHRFETAYSFNTPEDHKTYRFYDSTWEGGMLHHGQGTEVPYWPTSPYVTYAAMLACGLLGARRAARRERYGR